MASFFLLRSSFFRTTITVASSEAPADYRPAPGRTSFKDNGYKSVFTNLCLERQRNRSWIKGLGKNPQMSELIHWRQCLLSGGTEACFLGLRETPACIHVIPQMSQPRVACWHGYRLNSQKTECVLRRPPIGGWKINGGFTRPPKRTG